MDRFKFRIWDIKQQKYRQRTHHEADTCINCLSGKVLFGEGIEIYGEEDDKDVILEQCTGLKDKNGKLIYEGDIVKGKATIGEGGFEYLGCIRWYYQSELIGWNIEDKDGGAWELKQAHAKISADNITGEVIGNINENPDLLGEDK